MGEDLFEKGIAFLKKIQRSALPEDSKALYDKGMAMIQGEDPFAEEEVEETPEDEATDPEDPGEDTVQPEGEALEVDDAEATVDSVMDEQLEEATEEALKDKPE